ncbi:MAG: hypothetical protein WBM83_05405 [Flavobacteriaceae bacterium]
MRVFSLLLIGTLLLIGCKKDDPPKPPERATLVFPAINSECTTGQSLNETTSQVEFKWTAANFVETYELRVTNLNTSITQTISTPSLSAKLPIEKGAPFSWLVNTKNSKVSTSTASETWRFYNAGFQKSFAPFPPQLVAPQMAKSVFKDINNEITLKWEGADANNDMVGYDVYFSTQSPPETLIVSLGANQNSHKVSVVSNTLYFWRIVAKDGKGNTADSGIFSFKAL